MEGGDCRWPHAALILRGSANNDQEVCVARGEGKQRPHRPHALGPRTYLRGRYYWADLRPWDGERIVLRDPTHPDWPRAGERTEDEDIARQWSWAYVAHFRDSARRRAFKEGPPPRRLAVAIAEYLEHRAGMVSKNTLSSDRTALKHLAAFCGRETITTDQILAVPERDRRTGFVYIQDLVDQRLREHYAASTVHTMLTCLGPFFQWLGSNVNVWDVSQPGREEKEARAWSDDEIVELRKAADYVDRVQKEPDWPSARRVLEFFIASGAREQEGFAAEWPRINAGQRTIRFVYQLDKDTLELVALKGKRARTALLLPSFWEWYDARARGHVLARSDGRRLGYRAQRNLIMRILDAAHLGDPGCGYHTFRHTYGRLFIEQGGRLEELQKSLGHKSITTTERTYGHYHEDVAAKLAGIRIYRDEVRPRRQVK